jgi:hypothetical protein
MEIQTQTPHFHAFVGESFPAENAIFAGKNPESDRRATGQR